MEREGLSNTKVGTTRGGSRTTATSKMECLVITVNDFRPLTIITKLSILDVVAVLDPPVTIAICNNRNMVLVYLHFMDMLHIIKKNKVIKIN